MVLSILERKQTFSFLVVLLVLVLDRTYVLACPTGCNCRGRAVKCGPGLATLPSGLDATVSILGISGSKRNHNKFTSIQANYFQSSPSLFSLYVTYSDVQTIADGAFSGLNILQDLNLADNALTNLDPGIFKGLPKLRALDISGNVNCKFDGNSFTHITYIEELNIGQMGITKLNKNMFYSLTKLKVLKMYGNDIKRIRPEVLLPLSNLEALDITGNQLLGIPVELKPMFSQLKSAHLADNPWQCNCQLLWLKELKSTFTTSGLDTTEVVCNGPAKLMYASLKNAPESEFKCIPPKVVRCDSTTYSVNLQERLQVSCQFEGDPIPDVEWLRPDGYRFNDTDLNYRQYDLLENGTLLINGIGVVDDGAWRVRAYNGTLSDEMTVRIHVIITTTTLSTTPTTTITTTTRTTTTPTTTTTKTTTKPTMVISSTTTPQTRPASKLMTSLKYSQLPPQLTTNLQLPDKTEHPSQNTNENGGSSGGKIDIKENGINYGLLAAAAVAGGTIVGCICLIIMCCQKKKNDEQNKISPFDDAFMYDDGI